MARVSTTAKPNNAAYDVSATAYNAFVGDYVSQTDVNDQTCSSDLNFAAGKRPNFSGGKIPFATVGSDSNCDYVTDGAADAVQINAALAAASEVYLAAETFNIGGTSIAPTDNNTLHGCGYATQILSTSNIYNIDINSKDNVRIHNLRLTGDNSSAVGAGAGVRIQNGSLNTVVDHCFIDTFGTAETVGSDIYGIYCDYASHVRIHHNYFNDIAASAVMFLNWDPVANPTVDCIAHHNYAEDCEAGYSFNFGVRDCVYHHNKCYHTVNGCLMENHATYGAPMYCALDHNVFDTSASDMIQVGNSTTDAITSNIRIHGNIIKNVPANKQGIQVSKASVNIWINNNEFYAITASCINVGGGSNDLSSDLEIANNIFASGYRGIYFEGNGAAGGCSTSSIHGNRFDTSDYGIQMSGNSDGNSIRNNYFGAIGSGITISAGTCDINFISENDFNACTDDVADSGTGTVFGNNLWKDGSYDTTPPA